MNAQQRPLVIINGSLILPQHELTSGVVLIHGQTIIAAGRSQHIPVPANALLLDATQGHISAGNQQTNGNPIQPGQRADLVCIADNGSILWALCAGKICYPPHAPAPPPPLNWQQHRQTALDATFFYLQQRPETQEIRQTASLPHFQQRGIDILWQFQGDAAASQTLAIRVIPTLMPEPGSVFVLSRWAARHLPEASLSHTEAQWWFYHHAADTAIYALPTQALRQWLQAHARKIPLQSVQIPGLTRRLRGRCLTMKTLQRALPRARSISLPTPS